jgi:hypothetical protein
LASAAKRAPIGFVGWVERSETHHSCRDSCQVGSNVNNSWAWLTPRKA